MRNVMWNWELNSQNLQNEGVLSYLATATQDKIAIAISKSGKIEDWKHASAFSNCGNTRKTNIRTTM